MFYWMKSELVDVFLSSSVGDPVYKYIIIIIIKANTRWYCGYSLTDSLRLIVTLTMQFSLTDAYSLLKARVSPVKLAHRWVCLPGESMIYMRSLCVFITHNVTVDVILWLAMSSAVSWVKYSRSQWRVRLVGCYDDHHHTYPHYHHHHSTLAFSSLSLSSLSKKNFIIINDNHYFTHYHHYHHHSIIISLSSLWLSSSLSISSYYHHHHV